MATSPAGPWTQYAKPATAAAPAQTDGPWAKYASPADTRARAATSAPIEDPEEKQGFFGSFYDGAIGPVVDLVKDAYKRGDLGEHSAQQLLDSFTEQVKNFAGHPDIRNLPIVGTGATATAARMQKQFDAGNYSGMFGSAAGFLAPFAGPELLTKSSPELNAVVKATKTAGAKLRKALPDSIPEVSGSAADVAGLISPRAAHAISLGNRAARVANRVLGTKKAPLSPGEEILRSMRESNAERARIDASYEALPDGPVEPADWFERYIQKPEHWEPGPSGTPQPPEHWEPAPAVDPQWEPGPAGAPPATEHWEPVPASAPSWEPGPAAAPPAAAPWAPYQAARSSAAIDTAPDARATLPPDLVARVDELRTASHPGLSKDQLLEDAIDEHAARLQHQAEDIIWANRARKADRFALYLKKNNLDPTPENLATAARAMDERAAPSDETLSMVHDRMNFQPPEAVESGSNGRQAEAGAGNSEPSRGLDAGATGARPALHEPVRAAPEETRTTVDVPGEARNFGARYEVRELADLQPSHHGDTFQPNPNYSIENDRNYDDPVNQRKIVDWSAQGPTGFKPRNLLNTSPDASSGPPVVDSDGNVIGGNGRTMIAQRVYKTNPAGAQAYRQELDRTAAHYGVDPASYAGMKEPVLVRTIDDAEFATPGSKQRAVTDFNKVGTASLTPSERAIADSRGVSLGSLDDIAARMEKEGPDATLAQVLEGRSGIEVLGKLVDDGVISPQESAALGGESKLTKAGKDRISGLMLGRFFTSAKQMDALPDAVRNKMERLAAPLARVEGSEEYSLSPHIRRALDLLEDAAAHGASTLDDYLAQRGLFQNQKFSPEAIALAKQLRNRNPLALTNAVRAYAERAKYASEYQGAGMFGDIPAPLTPAQAFEESFGAKALGKEDAARAAKRDTTAETKGPATKPVKTVGDLSRLE